MRAKRISQISLFDQFAEHEIGRELQGMSEQLDTRPMLLDWVAADLGSPASTGRCGLIFDAAIEAGNPADSERFMAMLDRHIERYGRVPRQVAADGGYASKDNLAAARQAGVQDVAFHKKRGLAVEDMANSQWVYRKLRNFRAGIEAGISCLKRAYGLSRCTWKGLAHFKAYVWSSVVAHNLALLARLSPT